MGTNKPKKPRLPPMRDLEAVKAYFRKKGYTSDPILEDREDADLTLAKPLPDGRRDHIRIKKGRKSFSATRHFDRVDPGRDPLGHILEDVIALNDVPHTKFKIPKIPKRTEKKKR